MVAQVLDCGILSDQFYVCNGTKPGCVLAPLLFSIYFATMHNFVGVGTSSVSRTHAFPSRFSMDNSTMAPGVLVDSTNVTSTI